jgi:hypothetical protein
LDLGVDVYSVSDTKLVNLFLEKRLFDHTNDLLTHNALSLKLIEIPWVFWFKGGEYVDEFALNWKEQIESLASVR